MKIWIILLILLTLVSLDKIITAINIKQYEANFNPPENKRYEIEKNPMAKFFFEKLGLTFGSILYGIVSFIISIIGFLILSFFFGDLIALYVVFIVYSFVIGNNIFFMLKFGKVI